MPDINRTNIHMVAATGIHKLRRRWVKKIGRRVLHLTDRFISRQSLIGDAPVFDPAIFPWIADFEANWQRIRAELDTVLQNRDSLPSFHDLSPDQKRISKGDNWKTFVFYALGHRVDSNCKRCPDTARLLEKCPDLQNAWFSILKPGYRIPPHKGPTNGIVRIHLGLIIPEQRDQCWIRVDDRILHWDEGKCIVFDDSFEHEVQNNTDQQRVVLFFDVLRPLRAPGRILNNLMLSLLKHTAYFRDAERNIRKWEDRNRMAVG